MPTGAIGAYGTLLKIGDGGGTEVFTTIAEVRDINGLDLKTDTVDVTTHSSTGAWEEVIATIKRSGELKAKINFIPTEATHSYSGGLLRDFNNRTRRNFKLVFPDVGNTTWPFAAFVTGFSASEPVANELSADVTLKLTGAPTLA